MEIKTEPVDFTLQTVYKLVFRFTPNRTHLDRLRHELKHLAGNVTRVEISRSSLLMILDNISLSHRRSEELEYKMKMIKNKKSKITIEHLFSDDEISDKKAIENMPLGLFIKKFPMACGLSHSLQDYLDKPVSVLMQLHYHDVRRIPKMGPRKTKLLYEILTSVGLPSEIY